MSWLCNVLIGVAPQAFYITMMLALTKKLYVRLFRLYLLVFLSFVVSVAIVQFNIILYTIFSLLIFAALKLLYGRKAYWLDAIYVLSCMTLLSVICLITFMLVENFWIAFCIAQCITVMIPFIIYKACRKFYNFYCAIWNINKEAKIKSITVRNISVVAFNIAVLFTNYAIIYFIERS